MLEHLEDVPWATLTHAYGSASDVPDLIRTLTSPDYETREQAWTDLYGNLWHQGTVYEATAYAVPFFIELLQSPSVSGKDMIFYYLADLATGASYWDVHQHVPFISEAQREEIASGRMAEKVAKELAWVKAARDAVIEGSPVFRELLGDEDEKVKMGAAFLLGSFPESADANLHALLAAYNNEKSSEVRASIALALGNLATGNEDIATLLAQSLTSRTGELERIASAMALSKLSRSVQLPALVTTAAIGLLAATIVDSSSVRDAFAQMPGIEDDIEAYCQEALEALGHGAHQ